MAFIKKDTEGLKKSYHSRTKDKTRRTVLNIVIDST
jgi:hypothetical protein